MDWYTCPQSVAFYTHFTVFAITCLAKGFCVCVCVCVHACVRVRVWRVGLVASAANCRWSTHHHCQQLVLSCLLFSCIDSSEGPVYGFLLQTQQYSHRDQLMNGHSVNLLSSIPFKRQALNTRRCVCAVCCKALHFALPALYQLISTNCYACVGQLASNLISPLVWDLIWSSPHACIHACTYLPCVASGRVGSVLCMCNVMHCVVPCLLSGGWCVGEDVAVFGN